MAIEKRNPKMELLSQFAASDKLPWFPEKSGEIYNHEKLCQIKAFFNASFEGLVSRLLINSR